MKLSNWVENSKEKINDLLFYLKQRNGEIDEKELEINRLKAIENEAKLKIEN